MPFPPADPDFAARVRASFARQRVMETLGATLTRIEPGVVEIGLPFRDDLTQQHGFLHAGIVATILDSACGYAAFSLMPPDRAVLTVEYKINLMRPAAGTHFSARGTVVRPGQTLTVCTGEVVAYSDGTEKFVALMQATLTALPERSNLRQ